MDAALDFVKDHGYVNDENYAREYLNDKKGRKSYRQIRMELTRKGISGQILDMVFEEAGSQQEEDIRPQVIKYIRSFLSWTRWLSRKPVLIFSGKDIRPARSGRYWRRKRTDGQKTENAYRKQVTFYLSGTVSFLS